MKTLRDFIKENKNVSYGLIKASHISCQGVDENDIYSIYEHTKICPWCQNYIESQLDMEERLKPSDADIQRVIEQRRKREEMMHKPIA